MSYKLSPEICEMFRGGDDRFAELYMLDIRLGLEKIQDHPDFREPARLIWSGDGDVFGIPVAVMETFETPSPRNAVGVDAISDGLERIVYAQEFKESCIARWAIFDEDPWDANGVNLAAMPDGPLTA